MLSYHKKSFEAILQEAFDDAEHYFIELRYRFAIAQFRHTLSLKSSGIEITERVFDLLWRDLGDAFEAYANWAFGEGFSEEHINETVKQWLTEFQPKKNDAG
jgi:hypothetical protein